MSAIRVEGLTRRFGDVVAVDGLSFQVEAGEVVALLGPNGAGKTTTIEILEGYLAPSAGSVSVLGDDPRHADRAWRARIGLVLQSTSLDPQLSVSEVLGVFGALFARPRSVAETLGLIDLEAQADTRIGRLSGGQQRRVDLGLAIVGRPELLFLDEPTTGLDPAARRRTWTAVQALAAGGTTVLLSTHYMEEAQQLANRLLVLRDGRLIADATPDALRASALRSTVRLACPPGGALPGLPPALEPHFDPSRCELLIRTADVTGVLDALLDWARARDVPLDGLEVGPPGLEDAYLALTAPAPQPAVAIHA
ncbi:MAG: ABC transporter ATP-binding protein [Solirubrobacteraceae bacterium]